MSEQSSEEKTEQPSQQKLKKARERGQVAQSKDVVIAFTTTTMLLYLWFARGAISEQMQYLITYPSDLINRPFMEVMPLALVASLRLGSLIVLPLIGLVIVAVLLSNLIVLRGFLFSVQPLAPDFNKLNPASGFERIVSKKNLIDNLITVIKAILLIIIAIVVIIQGLGPSLQAPHCGLNCISVAFTSMLLPLIAAIIVMFLLFAFMDYWLQRLLFTEKMKMTKTELKRERKEFEGDPMIRGARRQIGRELVGFGIPVGMGHATFAIVDRSSVVIGLRYVNGETRLPLLVAKAEGNGAASLLQAARRGKMPIVEASDLALRLYLESPLGDAVNQDCLPGVAEIIARLPQEATEPKRR